MVRMAMAEAGFPDPLIGLLCAPDLSIEEGQRVSGRGIIEILDWDLGSPVCRAFSNASDLVCLRLGLPVTCHSCWIANDGDPLPDGCEHIGTLA